MNNVFLRSKYATLANVLEVVRAPLLENSVLLLQRTVDTKPGFVSVQTMLVHAPSGEFVSEITSIPLLEPEGGKGNMGQQTGALISYARRYAITCMLCLAFLDEDCDLELRTQPQPQQYRRFQPPQSVQQRTEHPVPQQAPAASSITRTNYPGLPQIPDITYEDSKDSDGRSIVIARGKTLEHKESLKRSGFR